jgi:hypothetical protein
LKPVFIEETIEKLKNIIETSKSDTPDKLEVDIIIDQIENSLKSYKDNNENKVLFYGASSLVIILTLILTFTTKLSWPLMFLVIWFGGFMYYRVHEKSLVLNNLDRMSKVENERPLSKIAFLKSAVDLKIGRKSALKIFLSIMISSSVMMAHFLFVDTSFWMNLGLLIAAIVASNYFWQYLYQEETDMLESIKEQMHQLENQIILSSGLSFEEE